MCMVAEGSLSSCYSIWSYRVSVSVSQSVRPNFSLAVALLPFTSRGSSHQFMACSMKRGLNEERGGPGKGEGCFFF